MLTWFSLFIYCSSLVGTLSKVASLSALFAPLTRFCAVIAGPEHILPGRDTTRLAQAAHRAGQQLRSSTTREHHYQQQQQRQATTTQALASRQAGIAAKNYKTVMAPTSTSEGDRTRHGAAAAGCHMRSTRVDGYEICEVRRPRRV